MNIFSNKDNEEDKVDEVDEVVVIEEPPSTPLSNEETIEEIVEETTEWFWTRWYRQRQNSIVEGILDRASKLGVTTIDLMAIEEIQSFNTAYKFALYGTTASIFIATLFHGKRNIT